MEDKGLDAEEIKKRAHALAKRGDFAAAKHLLSSLVPAYENSPVLWLALGDVETSMGDIHAAYESFRRTVTLAPTSKIASQSLFYALWRLARQGDENALEQAIQELGRFLSVAESDWHTKILPDMIWLSENGGVHTADDGLEDPAQDPEDPAPE